MIKIYLLEQPADLRFEVIWLTPGKIYDGELTPVIYDPQTLQPVPPSYVVICDDGKMRKVDSSFFITLEQLREEKLNQLLK
jgi:hypothetical protein